MNNMKKITFSLFAIAILIAGYVYFQYGDALFGSGGRIAPSYLYPNEVLTPGLADTDSYKDLTIEYNGKSYSQFFRQVSSATKRQVEKNYPDNCSKSRQYDHFIPKALGGSDSPGNLWCQPKVNMWNGENWGYMRKDAVEKIVIERMKGKKMTPLEAQKCLSEDWIRCWKKYAKPMIGGLGEADDGEDEIYTPFDK